MAFIATLQFTIPPIPHYIAGGRTINPAGSRHTNRRNIQVFDLLCVMKGCLYLAEEERSYQVKDGHYLILRPDCHHYPTDPCRENTEYYWIHFQTSGLWRSEDTSYGPDAAVYAEEERLPMAREKIFIPQTFTIELPQFAPLPKSAKMFETLEQLVSLEKEPHNRARWRQQTLFQTALEHLYDAAALPESGSAARCAEQAAAYLRLHYQEQVTAEALGRALKFHPVYIARCMQKVFGCAPSEYLLGYRLEQAKRLLLQTDLPIARIAEEVGFNQAAYFTSCFVRFEGITPRTYRQRFS